MLVRQVLGAISQFEKATLVAKLKAARERTGKADGRKSHAGLNPELVALARQLRRRKRNGHRLALRDIAAELTRRGHVNVNGNTYGGKSIASMCRR